MQINYQQDVAIDDIQQYLRRDCLEITGIPIVPDENTKDLVIELASAIGVNLVYLIFLSHIDCPNQEK
jgi:hypothetical protein